MKPYKPWRRWTANPTSRFPRGVMKWRCPTRVRPTRARTGALTTAPTLRAKPSRTTRTSCASPSGRTGKDRATTASPIQVQIITSLIRQRVARTLKEKEAHTDAHSGLKSFKRLNYPAHNELEGQSEAANYLFSMEVIFLSHS